MPDVKSTVYTQLDDLAADLLRDQGLVEWTFQQEKLGGSDLRSLEATLTITIRRVGNDSEVNGFTLKLFRFWNRDTLSVRLDVFQDGIAALASDPELLLALAAYKDNPPKTVADVKQMLLQHNYRDRDAKEIT